MASHQFLERKHEFERLLARYLDAGLNEEELAQFEWFLQKGEEYRDYFVDICHIAGSINDGLVLRSRDLQLELESPPSSPPILGFLAKCMPSLSSGLGGTITLAVAIVAVGLFGFLFWEGFFNESSNQSVATGKQDLPQSGNSNAMPMSVGSSQESVPTARLVEMTGCFWESQSLQVGDTLQEGHRILLKSGLLKIAFTGRAEVILEGPVDFTVISEKSAELRYGRVSANVFDAGKGFTIDAPGMRVLDLGTQFGFNVENDGQGEVHVFKGEVEVKLKEKDGRASHSRLLTTHRAAALDSQTGRIDNLRFDPSQFIRTFEASDLEITREYVETIKAASPVAYWRFEYLSDGCVLNEMSDHYRGSSPMRLVLSEDVQNKTLAVEQRSLTRPYMMVNEPMQELANSDFSAECWIKSDGYQWITPLMIYFPAEQEGGETRVAALLEILNDEGNYWEPHEKVVRGLHRIPPCNFYGAGIDCYTKEEYKPNSWTHLVMVNNGIEMRIYINGHLAATKPISGKIDAAPTLSIGRFNEFIYPDRRASDKEMAGQIDEVAIYNRCLDEQEIKEHHRLGIEKQPKRTKISPPRN